MMHQTAAWSNVTSTDYGSKAVMNKDKKDKIHYMILHVNDNNAVMMHTTI